ncbi:MAG: PHP domain-containing protein [Bacillota bacterium]|nr:PHP domain-containing protein [Bacillota bacterium]
MRKPKHIPSPVQARQGVFLWGLVQEHLECETLVDIERREDVGMKANPKLIDMHNHTVWSDGANSAVELIEDAIEKNIKILGFTDHFNTSKCPSISPEQLSLYIQEIVSLKEKYKHKISVLIGIEINSILFPMSFENLSFNQFEGIDFVLIECIDLLSDKFRLKDLEKYLNRFKCKVGLAHTDLFRLGTKHEVEGGIGYVVDFMKRNNIFWDINSNSAYECFDNIIYHQNQEEITELFEKLIKNQIEITVGSDKHSIDDIELGRFITANELAGYINSK